MASVYWTPNARRDIRDVAEYIARDSLPYAAAFTARVKAAIDMLRRFPRSGRVVSGYDDESIREVIVGNYRVVYRLRERRVAIVAVSQKSREF
jgi:toxin ParE1/3/4